MRLFTRNLLIAFVALTLVVPVMALSATSIGTDYRIRLATGDREVSPRATAEFFRALPAAPYAERGAVIQFYDLPDAMTRQALEAAGVRLYEYLPDMAFLASVPRSLKESDIAAYGVRWVGTLSTDEKLAEILRIAGTPSWSRNDAGVAQFTVRVCGHIDPADAADWLAAEYGAEVVGTASIVNSVDVRLPAENWFDLAGDERVVWVEPFLPRRELNNSNRANTNAEAAQVAPYSLDGAGVMVGEWDGGGVSLTHPDLAGRVQSGDGVPAAWHASHVAGTVLGSGSQSSGTYRGMAPAASMVSYQWWGGTNGLQNDYQEAFDTYGIDVSTNSWGVGYPPDNIETCEAFLGNYFSECAALDNVIRGDLGKTLAIAWAAGNERSGGSQYCGSLGMTWGTIIPYGTAKNTITIGAINSNNSTMTGFSSWGPVDDGRIKPELVAPGCQSSSDYGVTSTSVGSGYSTACGTSMATPTTAGCITLWLDRYKTLHPGSVPLGSTVKAAFVQSAVDLGDPGPEYDFGYGKIDVTAAVDVLNDGAFLEDQITDGDTLTWTFVLDGSMTDLSFTLAWDDPGAAANANPTLVNDLDLRLQSAQPFPATFLPWVLNPSSPNQSAIQGADHTNNLEQVARNVGGLVGTWTIVVIGYNIPDGPQKFSIAHTPGITLVQGEQSYAVSMVGGDDLVVQPGDRNLSYTIFNTGRELDTYDLTLTSARGWAVTPNPWTVTISGRADSTHAPVISIPLGTAPGLVDTVVATIVSQTDPGVTATSTTLVSVEAGYGVAVAAIADTAAVPGRTIRFNAVVTNLGTQTDVIDWSAIDLEGWTITPSTGSVALPLAGSETLTIETVIPPGAAPGTLNGIVVSGVSQGDPSATGFSSTEILVIDFPPVPSLTGMVNGVYTTNPQPDFVWTLGAYAPPPAGFDVFTYALEIGSDSLLTSGAARYNGLSDTAFVPPDPLADGPHFWRVVTYNATGDSSGFPPSARFDVDTQRPDPPVLLFPVAEGYGTDRDPFFTWGPVTARTMAAGSVMYFWELSADSTFATIRDSATTANLGYQLQPIRRLDACSTVVFWRVTATDPAGNVSDPAPASRYQMFIRGDVNFDCAIDAVDLSAMIDHVFFTILPPAPTERAELNCVAGTDAQDLSYLIDYVFFGGTKPCEPE